MVKSSVNIHSWAYYFTLMLIAASLPISKFAMSVSEFMLLGMWLFSGFRFRIVMRFFKPGKLFRAIKHSLIYIFNLIARNLTDKFTQFFRNRAAMIFTTIYLIHVLGLLYTSDFSYAFKDLRIKLPMLLFPIVISTMEKLKYKHIRLLMLFYTASIFVGTMISLNLIVQGDFSDIRFTSPYISSIRFGLNVSFAFFGLVYFVLFDNWFKPWHKIILSIISIWFVVYLVLLESVTSLSGIVIISLLFFVYSIFRIKDVKIRTALVLMVIAIPVSLVWFVVDTVKQASTPPVLDVSQLDRKTSQGNKYVHDTVTRGIEDGRYIGLYLCEKELRNEWNKRSEIPYEGPTAEGQKIKETLIRFLTSKDLRKDAEGVNALTDKEIKLIEQGVANYNYISHPGLRIRILKIMMGYEVYQKTGDPSGSSVMQRIEYSKAALYLIREHFWLGVGTGDIEDSLLEQYKTMKSELDSRYMFHAHNQFLAIFITFGVFVLLWFLFALIYPPYYKKRFSDYFFVTFFLLMMWSMLSDDTLETQAGVTLFAFFYSLMLFGKEKKNADSKSLLI